MLDKMPGAKLTQEQRRERKRQADRRHYARHRAEKIQKVRQNQDRKYRKISSSTEDAVQDYDTYREAATWQESRNRQVPSLTDPRLIAPPRVPFKPGQERLKALEEKAASKPTFESLLAPYIKPLMQPKDTDPRMDQDTKGTQSGGKCGGTLVDDIKI